MVHLRLNDRETNPNPHINFITVIPAADADDAKELLRALAAQVKPVMKAHGFVVNSLEEYEFNSVFAGRNWNNGETVEIVLRRPEGSFNHPSWLMSTLCHELAHIKHMNHSPAFHALWSRLRTEVRALQSNGYYGDGFWSSGTRLADAARVGGEGLESGELPEYMCGGAHTRARPVRRRRKRAGARPSNTTGAQTAKRRKAGARVKIEAGTGRALNEDAQDEEAKKRGAGFRKQAASKRARDERAAAIERRLAAMQPSAGPSTSKPKAEPEYSGTESDSDSDVELIPETDAERRQTLLDSSSGDDSEKEKLRSTTLLDFWGDFDFEPGSTSAAGEDAVEVRTGTAAQGKGKGKKGLVAEEVEHRKRENLGMAGSGQKLGGAPKVRDKIRAKKEQMEKDRTGDDGGWSCAVCTLRNQEGHLACGVCGTARGEAVWTGAGS